MIYTSIYVVIVYFMTDQPHDVTRFFLYLIAGLMDSFVAQSVGMTVGIAFQLEVRFIKKGNYFDSLINHLDYRLRFLWH